MQRGKAMRWRRRFLSSTQRWFAAALWAACAEAVALAVVTCIPVIAGADGTRW